MALICDTSGIYALYDADDAWHEAVRDLVESEHGPLIVSDGILAEIDYLLTARLGGDAVLDFISAIRAGDFLLEACRIEDLARAHSLLEDYRDFALGLADAIIMATAERLHCSRILTLDQRHFRAVRPLSFDHFVILPQDDDGSH